MSPKIGLECLVMLVAMATPILGARTYLYFSDYNHCGNTYTVRTDDIMQLEAKRESQSSSSAFTSCELLFRAGDPSQTLCVKINTLSFSNNKIQYQYFNSLDPMNGTIPDRKYDLGNPAAPPVVFCDNAYEITMKLHILDGTPSINDVQVNIEVYNMQGTQRIAYMDTDCGLNYNLSDSTVYVQNRDPDGPGNLQSTCQLYFNYIGGNVNNTVCLIFTKSKDDCGYELRVRDGSALSSTLAHTYSCDNTQPQQWCGSGSSIYLELIISVSTPLPVGVFSLEVKDAPKDFTFPNGNDGPSGLATWAIIVIVVVVLVVVVAIAFVAFVFIKKSKG